jgi:hypothetical protein
VTLDIKKDKTPNPNIESGKGHGKEQKTVQGKDRTCGSGFSRDSIGSPRGHLRSKGN